MFLAVFPFKRAYRILRRSVVVDWEGTEEGKIAYKPARTCNIIGHPNPNFYNCTSGHDSMKGKWEKKNSQGPQMELIL